MKNEIIAEIGSVHDGSFGNAINIIRLAKKCGANAVKFQYHISEEETTIDAPSPHYFKSESRWDYFKRISFSKEQWRDLYNEANKNKLRFVVSPFSIKAAKNLMNTGIDCFKIASGEVTNTPMLEFINSLNKPVILSTGMSNWNEITKAVNIFDKIKSKLVVMQCSSIYPCGEKDVGLNLLSEIKKRYKCIVGFSDHTLGYAASISAATLGAKVIEKHFTFNKNMYGSDSAHAMNPDQFKLFTKEVFSAWEMIKNPVNKDEISNYRKMRNVFQKSIFIKKFIPKDSKIKFAHLEFKKPGDGISASRYAEIIGKKAKKNLNKNSKLKIGDFI